ncbi:CCHC-type domain-containing protein, partial [Aphis craccivora]
KFKLFFFLSFNFLIFWFIILIFSSCIFSSSSAVFVFFQRKNPVDFVINNNPNIKLNDHTPIQIRRSTTKSQNPTPISDNTHINAGFNIQELAHILSFRRQFYINHEYFHKLSNSLLITAENLT